jgi:hypothetical protein
VLNATSSLNRADERISFQHLINQKLPGDSISLLVRHEWLVLKDNKLKAASQLWRDGAELSVDYNLDLLDLLVPVEPQANEW